MTKLASVEELLGAGSKRRYKTVTLPVSGFTVRLRSLSEKDFSEYQASFLDSRGNRIPTRLRLANCAFIGMCVVDEDGNRMLTGDSVQKIAEWDAADALFLYNQCAEHCGIGRTDISELVKNSEETTES